MKKIAISLLFFVTLFFAGNAYASKGEFEVGAGLLIDFIPSQDIVGGGVDIFARYEVVDSLKLALSLYLTGNHSGKLKRSYGLFHLRAGALYFFDVVQWVPFVGGYITTLFSNHDDYHWHRKDFGLGLDLELGVQYRGIRPFAIGFAFTYHLFFTKLDYMPDFFTFELSFSWITDNF